MSDVVDLENRPWRVGRKVGRTIYAENTGGASDPLSDPLIGVMDTRELAQRVVDDHNAGLLSGPTNAAP